MSHRQKNSGTVTISVMNQSLTSSFVTEEGSFDAVLRNYFRLCTESSVKFGGGSVMLFGMNSAAGTGPLVRLHSKINTTEYKEILKKHVPNLRTVIKQPAVFMQDNVPYHTAKSVKTFLSKEDVSVMKWPTQSLNMNPIENIWKVT